MARGAVFNMRTSSPLGPRERLAPRSVRVVAALVDIVLFYPLLFAALAAGVVALGGALGVAVTGSRAGPWLQTLGSMFRASGLTLAASVVAILAGLAALVVLLTQWSMLARSGQTIGKWLMGIRIVDERGEAAGLIRALLLRRWVFNAVYVSIGVTLMAWVPFVGWAWWCLDVLPLFGEERRCLHDHVAVTDVRWVRPSGPGVERVLVGLALIASGVGGVMLFVGPAGWPALATLAGWKVPAAPVVSRVSRAGRHAPARRAAAHGRAAAASPRGSSGVCTGGRRRRGAASARPRCPRRLDVRGRDRGDAGGAGPGAGARRVPGQGAADSLKRSRGRLSIRDASLGVRREVRDEEDRPRVQREPKRAATPPDAEPRRQYPGWGRSNSHCVLRRYSTHPGSPSHWPGSGPKLATRSDFPRHHPISPAP